MLRFTFRGGGVLLAQMEFEPLSPAWNGDANEASGIWHFTLWIFDAVRHLAPEEAARVFKRLRRWTTSTSIVGIGIGGDERHTGAEPFRQLYREARANGLQLTAHAGETSAGRHLVGREHWRGANWSRVELPHRIQN